MGSGSREHRALAEPLGEWIARAGYHLLTGGGSGVMAAASRGFQRVPERLGSVLAVLPADAASANRRPPAGYPNEWVEIPIRTHLPLSGERGTEPLSRNHINVLTADVVLALPGSSGTSSEVRLALAYRRPVAAHVRSREDIPRLPDEVEVLPDLAAVAAFVRSALAT